MNFDLDTEEGMGNAVQWTLMLFQRMTDNATWMVPRSGTIIRINKKEKIAALTGGHLQDPSLKRVIEAMGWTVVEM